MTGEGQHEHRTAQDRARAPEPTAVHTHHAGRLVRVNLAPLMGLRDAALAAAEELLVACDGLSPEVIFDRLGPAIAEMFGDAADASRKIIGMFNNPDTLARESRLLNNVGILVEISGALADFRDLNERMLAAVAADAGKSEDDRTYTDRLGERFTGVAALLTAQLRDAYGRYRGRLARYRAYAVQNLSAENAERYRLAYDSAAAGYRETIDFIKTQISNSKTEELSR